MYFKLAKHGRKFSEFVLKLDKSKKISSHIHNKISVKVVPSRKLDLRQK